MISASCVSRLRHNRAIQCFIAGDMFKAIPKNHDIHLFSNALHDWDMNSVEKLINNSYTSLNQNGSIIVFDAHLNENKNGPIAVAEYSCLLMHSTQGRCYSTKEIGDVLKKVGFSMITITEIAAGRTMIAGIKN